jgi:hypothetical protein
MLDRTSEWQPGIGERVGIRDSRLLGRVERIEGEGAERRFILRVSAPPDDDVGAVYELTQAASVARTSYTLDELKPYP